MAASPGRACRFSPLVELGSGRLHAIAVTSNVAEARCPMRALATLATWRRTRPAARDVAIAVELALADMARITPRDLLGELARQALPPESLMLRVPRFAAGESTRELDPLAELGVSISVIDLDLRGADAGLLAGAPIDVIELPRADLAEIERGESPALRRAVTVAHRHDWLTVAYGVVRASQAAALERLGCDLHAGPLVGDLDEDELDRWLAARPVPALAG